jgi:hypothetical protein
MDAEHDALGTGRRCNFINLNTGNKAMTSLTKAVRRLSGATVFEVGKLRQITVTLMPRTFIRFRAQGCKRYYDLDIEAAYWLAVKAEQAAKAKEKKHARKMRKKTRPAKVA